MLGCIFCIYFMSDLLLEAAPLESDEQKLKIKCWLQVIQTEKNQNPVSQTRSLGSRAHPGSVLYTSVVTWIQHKQAYVLAHGSVCNFIDRALSHREPRDLVSLLTGMSGLWLYGALYTWHPGNGPRFLRITQAVGKLQLTILTLQVS